MQVLLITNQFTIMNQQKLQDKKQNLLGLVVCFFFGHKKVDGKFTDERGYVYNGKCSRCGAFYGHPINLQEVKAYVLFNKVNLFDIRRVINRTTWYLSSKGWKSTATPNNADLYIDVFLLPDSEELHFIITPIRCNDAAIKAEGQEIIPLN